MKPESHAVQELEEYIDSNFIKEDRRALYEEAARFAHFKDVPLGDVE